MPGGGRLRTPIVRGLRVVLPLAALAILSMLFLLARNPSPDIAIPYVDPEGGDLAQRTGMTAPRFAGVTPDGARYTLSAARAVPDGDEGAASVVALDWRAADGTAAELRAGHAALQDGTIHMTDDVRMTTSAGWVLTAPAIDADTDASLITAPSVVQAAGPFGTVEAGGAVLARNEAGEHVLDLNGGVRLIYDPRP